MQRAVKVQAVGLVVLLVACWVGAAGADYLDPTMVGAFVDLTNRNRLAGDFANTPFELQQVDSNYICIKQRLKNLIGSLDAAENYMAGYAYDSDGDPLAKKYVETAKARGNTVRSYKPAVNQLIAKKFYSPATSTPMPNTRTWAGRDRALIEFDKEGRIVSFMSRIVQASRNIGSVVQQYTSIYLGPQNARGLENLLDNRTLADNFLREY